MLTSPCFQCPRRCLGCHSTCDDYKLYQDQCKQAKQRRIDGRPPAQSPGMKARKDRWLRGFYTRGGSERCR